MAASVEVVTRVDQGPFGQKDATEVAQLENMTPHDRCTAKCIRMLTQAKKFIFHGLRKTFKSWAPLMTDSGHFENPMLRRHGLAGHLLSWLAEWCPGQNSASFGPSCP